MGWNGRIGLDELSRTDGLGELARLGALEKLGRLDWTDWTDWRTEVGNRRTVTGKRRWEESGMGDRSQEAEDVRRTRETSQDTDGVWETRDERRQETGDCKLENRKWKTGDAIKKTEMWDARQKTLEDRDGAGDGKQEI